MRHNEHITKVLPVTALFVDIGGVLLTNGWNRHASKRAARAFDLDLNEMEDWHHLNFATYEERKLSLEEDLGRVVFCQKRPFTRARFRRFIFALYDEGELLKRA
jgi:putative hydrolase of the HAD superfamily